jgi:serine/threonine protein kinase
MREVSSGVGAIDTGQLIAGHYRLVEHIGSGAMGVVWRAIDERLERSVAVKQILAQPGLSEAERDNVRQRAMREAKNAARFQHPNAIVVFDIAEHGGDPCLVMEYLPSRSLSAVLADQQLTVPQVAKVGEQVAAALVAAHRAGIVHRDVKPGNILIDDNGTTKITDFGISRAAGDLTLTQTGLIGGTPAYLAPELARGSDPTPASDVFALGATLYHALEGQPPYGNSTNQLALLYTAANGQIIPPQQSGQATALLMNLLRSEPEDRPSMVETRERLAALTAADSGSNSATVVSPPLYQPGRQPMAPPAEPAEPPPWKRTGAVGPPTPPRNQTAAFASAAPPQQPPMQQNGPIPQNTTAQRGAPPERGNAATRGKPGGMDARRKGILIGSLAAAVVVVAVVVFTLLNSSSGGNQADPDSSESNSPSASSSAQSPSSVAPAGLGQATSTGRVDYSGAGNLVVDYFSNKGSPQAWAMLTPAAQQVFGSQEAFTSYWSGRQADPRTARADKGANPDGSVDMYVTINNGARLPFRVVNTPAGLRIDANTKIG